MPDEFPPVPADLLAALELLFPDRCPDLATPERELWAQVGRCEVVRLLRARFDEQNTSVIQR
jgi:hypothetical protein